MLQFLIGPEGSGKTRALFERIRQRAAETDRRFLVVVPEQYSLQTERSCQHYFKPDISSRVDVVSFTRLAHLIFRTYGGLTGAYADGLAKQVVMHLALQQVRDQLVVYRRSAQKKGFAALLLDTVEELKHSAVNPSMLTQTSQALDPGKLQQKSAEVALVFEAYQQILSASYRDRLDDLIVAAQRVAGTGFFGQYEVFFEHFVSFNQPQVRLIEQMLDADLTFVLCLDATDSSMLFDPTRQTLRSLQKLARQHGVALGPIQALPPAIQDRDLAFVERNILRNRPQTSDHPASSVQVLLCRNEYEEIDELLARVWELVQDGFRFRDIVMVTRDLDSYQSVLESALDKYGIPYFMDQPASLQDEALFELVLSALDAASGQQPLASLVSLLKSGLTRFTVTDVSTFENYLFTWNITFSGLKQPFTQNPRGFVEPSRVTDQDREALRISEQLRSCLVASLNLLTEAEPDAESLGAALIGLLEKLGVPETLDRLIAASIEDGQPVAAARIERNWNILVELVETLAQAIGNHGVGLEEYNELFHVAVDRYDLGEIPQSLDAVQIGSADRMILGEAKVVMIFGANAGVFPYQPSFDGIFSEVDREKMERLGVSLSRPIAERLAQERLAAYIAMCTPSKRLILSARLADLSGAELIPSELIDQLTRMFGEKIVVRPSEQSYLHLCKTEQTTLHQLAFHYQQNDGCTQAIKALLGSDPVYQDVFSRLEQAAHPQPFEISQREHAQALFGKQMLVSPTQVENFYRCKFLFFCASGMRAYPRKKADLDPLSLGTVVHFVMEQLLSDEAFLQLEPEHLQQRIASILRRFFEQTMGGEAGKTARFVTLYRQLEESLLQLAENIQREFAVSRFRPAAFELRIGEGEDLQPLQLPLSGGGSVKLVGSIDRVDAYQKDGDTYLRVVDYKSGSGKSFRLSDVYYGLNMQMLLYLFSVWEQGSSLFANPLPAGILYLPANGKLNQFVQASRHPDPEKLEQELADGFRMNGLLLDDPELLAAMEQVEPGQTPRYLPIALEVTDEGVSIQQKSMEFVASLEEMERIRRFALGEITQMCETLLAGQIGPRPCRGYTADVTCKWCDYASVCGYQDQRSAKLVAPMSKQAFLEQIQEQTHE